MTADFDETLNHVRSFSKPSDLKITDMRFADIEGAPLHCILMKLYTNQGLVGFGEVRDGASRTYALMLKSRILGENPCNIDKLFRRIKQFGGPGRQAGGVCGIEVALWDLAGKAYGVPVYQMLGGRFRDRIRIYCDTSIEGRGDGKKMGKVLKRRMDMGFTFLKMDLGIEVLNPDEGTLTAPAETLEELKRPQGFLALHTKPDSLENRIQRNRIYDRYNALHSLRGIQITEKGLDLLEQYVAAVREQIGYEIPLAIDHLGPIPVNECIKLARRIERYSIAWLEDPIPWQLTDQYVKLSRATTVPICTGEDIYLKENFRPLLESGGVSVIHPDILTSGGILEIKKIGDMAQDHGVAMAIHMAESPIACLAAVHSAAATENFLALEFHSVDVSWWNNIVTGLPNPLVQGGFITVPDSPGLGIESLNDEVIGEHLHPDYPQLWQPTKEWDDEWSHDRTWS
jgi:gluconate/galactonate dehydratase